MLDIPFAVCISTLVSDGISPLAYSAFVTLQILPATALVKTSEHLLNISFGLPTVVYQLMSVV